MKNIQFVTGSTGFIGRYLTQALLEVGYEVWVLVRNKEADLSDLANTKGKLRIIEGDITKHNLGISNEAYDDMLRNKVDVWHLAANLSFRHADKADIFKTNLVGTKNIVKFANKVADNLYFMSTAYVHGNSEICIEEVITRKPVHRNDYEASKFHAEKIIHTDCKVPFLVFRPSIVIGDTYKGKALGCTFGYYRYTYLFYFLRKTILKFMLDDNSLAGKILRLIGTKYDKTNEKLSLPWVLMPYPKGATVDLITVDYVIDSMIELVQKTDLNAKIFHITNPKPPEYKFLLKALMEDLYISDVRLVGVKPYLFSAIFKIIHYIVPVYKSYTKSVLWYLPYIAQNNFFDRTNIERNCGIQATSIDRKFIRKINTYARDSIYREIDHKES